MSADQDAYNPPARSSEVLTVTEGEALAERTLAAIDASRTYSQAHDVADRERVASDLRALKRADEGLREVKRLTTSLHGFPGWLTQSPSVVLWLTHDFTEARADAVAGLLRTAALYGASLSAMNRSGEQVPS